MMPIGRSKGPENGRDILNSYRLFRSYTTRRATKGIGRSQPIDWKDAGEALGNDELKGCLMPNGSDNTLVHTGRVLM